MVPSVSISQLVEKLSERTSMKAARHSMQNFGTSSQTPTPPASESSGVPARGSNGQHGFVAGVSSPPAYSNGTPSSSMGDMHQQRNGGFVAPRQPQRVGSNQSGLGHYAEYPSQNPYNNSNTPFDDRETFAELDDGTQNHPRPGKTVPAELA